MIKCEDCGGHVEGEMAWVSKKCYKCRTGQIQFDDLNEKRSKEYYLDKRKKYERGQRDPLTPAQIYKNVQEKKRRAELAKRKTALVLRDD